MKKNKLKFLLLGVSLTTIMSVIPTVLVSCSSYNKSALSKSSDDSSSDSNNPSTPKLPIIPSDGININNVKLSKNGGTHNGLTTNLYLDVVKALDLSSSTNIADLNNDGLNWTLKNKYPDLNVSILNGSSEYDGLLKLNLVSKNRNINDNINITGFNVLKYEKYSIVSSELNLKWWFKNFQPIVEIDDNNIKQDLSILSSFKINVDGKIDVQNNKNNFLVLPIFKRNNDKLIIDFKVKQIFEIYYNGIWTKNKIVELKKTNAFDTFSINLPNINDFFNFLLEEINVVDDNIKSYYPSYFYRTGIKSIKKDELQIEVFNFLNIDKLFKKYKQKYFPNTNYQIVINNDNFFAEDLNGFLTFSIFVKNLDNPYDSLVKASHQIEIVDCNILNINGYFENKIIIKKDSELYNNLNLLLKNEIENVKNLNNNSNINNYELQELLNTYFSCIYDYAFDENKIDNLIKQVNDNYTFSIFNNAINNLSKNIEKDKLNFSSFNPLLGLYTLNNDYRNSFYIKTIYINCKDDYNARIKLNDKNNIVIEINVEISITLSDDEIIIQNAIISCEFTN